MPIDFDYISHSIGSHRYKLIGSGSGRLVFDLGDGYVVKVAKNKKGIVQNKAEFQISSMADSDLFARVIAVSDNNHYLIMEKADRIRSMTVVWNYFNVNSNRDLFQLNIFRNFPEKYQLLFGDLCRKSSWGMSHGKPVIIDFGFTREARKYYSVF